MQDQYEVLYRYFGYTAFRSGQAELIDAQLSGRDVFGIMPTGGGKSLCYQIPALMLEGITLVVSPLISLMKDQVTALKNMGVSAAYVNRSLSAEQIRLVLRNIQQKKYKIIYIAPERLLTESFLAAISNLKIAMVAVDEAHCISQWGQDFRPSYLRIADFLKLLKVRPVVSAFTATATQEVRDDVERILGLQNPLRIITGYDRPNLRFAVVQPKSKPWPCWTSLKPDRENAVSSIAPPEKKWKKSVKCFKTRAFPQPDTMQGCPRRSGIPIRTILSMTAAR